MEVQLRKHQNMLVIIGSGVMSFGMWSAIKMVLYSMMRRSEFRETIAEQGASEDIQGVLLIIMYLFIGIGLAFILALRSYIGLSARAEGMGKKRGNGASSLFFLYICDLAQYNDKVNSVVIEGIVRIPASYKNEIAWEVPHGVSNHRKRRRHNAKRFFGRRDLCGRQEPKKL